ncbi:sushi domain (scr repeat) domain-containing protein [Cryptosporidium felis]|nr:sushi domain (scr repeat) domain-containing protein [Cryptosporidium felis]
MKKVKLVLEVSVVVVLAFQALLQQTEGALKKTSIVSSSGLVCEDNPSVAESGYSCSFLARRFGGFLGCEKLLKDLAQDSLPSGIPGSTRVVDACPNSCNKCRECSPGCALWFIGNGVCDPECDNLSCQFDGGDCWKVDCKLSAWSSWSSCSVTCGPGGRVTRTRQIVVSPRNGGESCGALKAEETGCNSHIPCPLSCTVSEWGSWSRCSSSCGLGHQMRERSVIKAPKDQNLYQCPETRQIRECFQDSCTSNCTLGEFKFKSAVSGSPCTSDLGCVERREILLPPFKASQGNFTCEVEERVSNCLGLRATCPESCQLSEWSGWSTCSYFDDDQVGPIKTKEGELRQMQEEPSGRPLRYRLLKKRKRVSSRKMKEAKCVDEVEYKECDEAERQGVEALVRCNMGDWSSWSSCSTSCGLGSRLRARWLLSEPENKEVISENLLNTESVCGPLFQTKACNDRACLADSCKVSDWSQWSSCSSSSCNSPGISRRFRSVISLPRKGDCPILEEIRDCLGPCDHSVLISKSNCMFGDWSSWSSCQDECYTKYSENQPTRKRYRHKMMVFSPKDK